MSNVGKWRITIVRSSRIRLVYFDTELEAREYAIACLEDLSPISRLELIHVSKDTAGEEDYD